MKVEERFLIHLILPEQFGVIAKVAQEPIELPERSSAAVQPPGEGMCGEGFGLKDYKAENEEWLLRMPAVGSGIHAHQEEALETTINRLAH